MQPRKRPRQDSNEDFPLAATTQKGRARAAMTQELLSHAAAGRVQIAIARASDFFGAGVTETTLGERVFANTVTGARADFLGNPDLPHTYSYVPDIAVGFATLGTDARAIGAVWHLPGPQTVSTRALLDLVAAEVWHPVGVRSVPRLAMRALGLFNPTMRELVEMTYEFDEPFVLDTTKYTALAEDSNGALVRFNWRSVPGGVITEHVHPHQEERFTIVAGEAHFTLNGEELVARAGETIVVPAGARHSEGNAGSVEIEGVVELRPALRTKEFHEALAGLVTDGMTTSRGAPKNPLQLGATFWHFRHESRVTSPPIWAQNFFLPPLAALAKVFCVHAYYERWDSRTG